MTQIAYERIASGLKEALAVVRGEATGARLHVPVEDVEKMRDRFPNLEIVKIRPPAVKIGNLDESDRDP